MFSFNAIYVQLLKERLTKVVTESYISKSMFANVLVQASGFFLLLYAFSQKYTGITSSSVFKTYGGPVS